MEWSRTPQNTLLTRPLKLNCKCTFENNTKHKNVLPIYHLARTV